MMVKYFLVYLFLFAFVFITFAHDKTRVLYGKATYYHNRFEGRKTANGEKFSHKQFTCAHKTLPINTFLKVTNLINEKTIILRVNDRLPKKSKVLLDLTFTAAKELDFIRKGSADIRVEILDTANIQDNLSVLFAEAVKGMKIGKNKKINNGKVINKYVSTDSNITVQHVKDKIFKKLNSIENDTMNNIGKINQSSVSYGVQVLSYNSQKKAQFIAESLTKLYNESVSVKAKKIHGKMYYRVIIGQCNSKSELLALKNKLTKEYKDCYAMVLD